VQYYICKWSGSTDLIPTIIKKRFGCDCKTFRSSITCLKDTCWINNGQEWRVTPKIKIMQLNTPEMILWFCVVSGNGRFSVSHYVQYCPHLKDTVFLVQVSDVGQIWTIKFLYLFNFARFKGKVDSCKISFNNWRNWNDQSSSAAQLPSGFCTVTAAQWNSWTLPIPRLTWVSDHIISCYRNWLRNKKPSVIHSKMSISTYCSDSWVRVKLR